MLSRFAPAREWLRFGWGRLARLSIGAAVGAVIAAVLAVVREELNPGRSLSGISWKPWVLAIPNRALIVLIVCALLPGIPSLLSFANRFRRSWWNGLHSLLIPAGAWLSWAILSGSHWAIWLGGLGTAVLLAVEVTRHPIDHSRDHVELPKFTRGEEEAGASRWRSNVADSPITDPVHDLVGRGPILERLAHCALRERMPIIALQGGYGDGKTSVLNLLEGPLSNKALVLYFKSWLPGSETSLAAALLRDISTTINKHVFVPRLRQRAAAFFRIIAGSASQLGGVKELIPAHTQSDEFRDLAAILKRVPKPVVILIDEIDRMEQAEVLTLFKLLRGATELPNVTFICAFSETDLRRIVSGASGGSDGYFEKFFPATLRLPPPSAEAVARVLRDRVSALFTQDGVLATAEEVTAFRSDFDAVWESCLKSFASNLRSGARLATAVELAWSLIAGEVEPLDVILLEALRLVSPHIYQKIRKDGYLLTERSVPDSVVLQEERRKEFLQELAAELTETPHVHRLIAWLFPDYEDKQGWRYKRKSNRNSRRVFNEDRFQLYFRSAVPDEIFSEAELGELMDALLKAETLDLKQAVLERTLIALPSTSPKRFDLLARFRFRMAEAAMSPKLFQEVALALCRMAHLFSYDLGWAFAEAGQALQIVLLACKEASSTTRGELIKAAIASISDDTFAYRVIGALRDERNNAIPLSELPALTKTASEIFVKRMRDRYAPGQNPNMAFADHQAFREWMQISPDDTPRIQQFFEAFVGISKKQLAAVSRLVYPEGFWSPDGPRSVVEKFLPLPLMRKILSSDSTEELTPNESDELARLAGYVVDGKYISQPGGGFVIDPEVIALTDMQ